MGKDFEQDTQIASLKKVEAIQPIPAMEQPPQPSVTVDSGYLELVKLDQTVKDMKALQERYERSGLLEQAQTAAKALAVAEEKLDALRQKREPGKETRPAA